METAAKEIICLGCPNGCHLLVRHQNGEVTVEDAQCERGEEYGREELLEPKRVVTAVVKTTSAAAPYVPVKTSKALPKPLIAGLLEALYTLHAATPITCGQTLISDFQGSGVDVVYTRTVKD